GDAPAEQGVGRPGVRDSLRRHRGLARAHPARDCRRVRGAWADPLGLAARDARAAHDRDARVIVRRAVILGATSLAGREVAERLRDRRVALGELATCEPGTEANVLSAVAGDLVVSTSDVREAVDGVDVVISCTELAASDAALVRAAASEGTVVLDLA